MRRSIRRPASGSRSPTASDPTVDFETMIRDADTAMYQAKDAGRDGIAVFDQSMRAARRGTARARAQPARRARARRARSALPAHRHPARRRRSLGVEALVRWSHPTARHGSRRSKFIPIAEDMGLITELGGWVLDEACRQLAIWRDEVPDASELYVWREPLGPPAPRSASRRPGPRRAARRATSPPRALCLELTESILTQNIAERRTARTTSTSSGSACRSTTSAPATRRSRTCKRFPIDYVKIDRVVRRGTRRADERPTRASSPRSSPWPVRSA